MEALQFKIKKRLEKYLQLDVDGIRRFIMKILLNMKTLTVDTLHEELNKKFKISHSAVASMLGYIHSKLGILHTYKESYKTPTVYKLKEEYVEVIRNALGPHGSI